MLYIYHIIIYTQICKIEFPLSLFTNEKSETSKLLVPRLWDFMGKLKKKKVCMGGCWDQTYDC